MGRLFNLYAVAGKAIYPLQRPLMSLVIRHTRRAYVILVSGGEILVVKNWLGRGDWGLPGGGVGRGETPAAAACREAHEELGIKLAPESLELVSQGRWRTDSLGHTYYVFIAKVPKKPPLSLRRHEIITAGWLVPDKLAGNAVPAELANAITRAGL